MDIKLYHARHARSLRVLWLLEEMGLPYNLEIIDLELGNTGGKEYAKINPLQKVPAVVINGEVLQESTAILEFIANRFGGSNFLVEKNHGDYGRFLQWLHGGESGFGMYLSLLFGHTVLLPKNQRSKATALWAEDQLKKQLSLFGKALGTSEFIVADRLTIADISVAYVIYGISLLGKQQELAPDNVQSWWQCLAKRDRFQKAITI